MARKKENYTKQMGFEAVARSLREFGYPDASAKMVSDTYDAMKRGDKKLPHGVVGMFAESQLKEVWDKFETLP